MPDFAAAAAAFLSAKTVEALVARIIITIATSTILSNAAAGSAKRRAARSLAEARANQTIMVRSAAEARKVVYGEAVISGPIAFAESTGAANSRLHLVIPLCEGEVDAITEVFVDEDPVGAVDANGWATTGRWVKTTTQQNRNEATANGSGAWSVTLPYTPVQILSTHYSSGDDTNPPIVVAHSVAGATVSGTGVPPGTLVTVLYTHHPAGSAEYLRVRKHLGAAAQAADSVLVAEVSDKWTADHRLRGIAYLYATLVRDETIFPTGLGNIKARVRGRRLYDPRDGVTRYETNPALVIRDYLTAPYGLGCDASEINEASFIAAANVCEELVASAGSSGYDDAIARGDLERRFSVNGVVDLSQQPREILQDLLQTCQGTLTYSEGQWRLTVAAYVAPTITLTEADLAGYATVQKARPRRDLFNGVQGVYVSLENAGQVSDFPAYRSSTYAAADGGEIMRDVDLPFTATGSEAQRLARLMVEIDRRSMVVQFPANLRQATRLQVGDRVMLTLARFSFVSKVFQVVEWSRELPHLVHLVLREDDAGAYSWNHLSAAEIPPPLASELPNPFARPPVPTSFQLLSGEQYAQRSADGSIMVRIRASWDAATDPAVLTGGHVELELRRADETEVAFAGVARLPGDAVETMAGPVQSDAAYVGRLRFVNAVGVVSDWSYDTVTADGKTSGPQTPTGLTATAVPGGIALTWVNPSDPDFDRVEIWTNTIDQVVSATKIETVRAATWLHFGLAGGATRFYWVRALDRYGNWSAFTASATATAQTATGTSTALVFAYKRSAGAPTDNPGAVTFTFASASITTPATDALANGWTKTIPAGTNPLYVVAASASSTGPTDTIAAGEWSSPVILARDGADGTAGINSATVYLYRRTATATAPTVPNDAVDAVYTFAPPGLTNVPAGWSTTIPSASSGDYLWVTQAAAAGTGLTDAIPDTQWATPQLLAQKGDAGDPGDPGADAIGIKLRTTSQVFRLDEAGNEAPVSITLTALQQNTSEIVDWTTSPVITSLNGTTGSSKTLYFEGTTPHMQGNSAVTVTATLRTSGISDTVTIVSVRDGSSGITPYLTNPTHNVEADAGGSVTSYASASGEFKVYRGGVDISTGNGITYSVASESYAALNTSIGSSTGAYSISSPLDTWGGVDSVSVVLRATLPAGLGGAVIDLPFKLTKVRRGGRGVAFVTATSALSAPPTVQATINSACLAALQATYPGAVATLGDAVTLYNAGASPAWSRTWSFNGTNWTQVQLFVDGSAVVTGTLSAGAIGTGAIQASGATGVVRINQTPNNGTAAIPLSVERSSNARPALIVTDDSSVTTNSSVALVEYWARMAVMKLAAFGTTGTGITLDVVGNNAIGVGVSASFSDAAVSGFNSGAGDGVKGRAVAGKGVSGSASTGIGVKGAATGTSGIGVEGRSTLYFGGAFYGGTDSAPLYLNPSASLPTVGAIVGGFAVYNNKPYFHNGTSWREIALV